MARTRARRAASLGTAVALAAGLVVQACSREVVLVEIRTVSVSPSEAPMVLGATVQFSATVVDDRGVSILGCGVEWSSDNPQVVSISSTGLAEALQQGQATIHAECLEVSGEATVTVIGAAQAISVNPSSLSFNGTPGASPAPKTVDVDNSGDGRLTGLAVQVQYSSSGMDWLTATLAGTEAPTTLTVTPETSGLPVGEYAATIRLTSPVASPVPIQVTLSISSISVEGDESLVVDEAGTLTDDFTVALDLQPASDVVLLLTSADPAEVTVDRTSLTFTPENWAVPQTVTVTGHDDLINDGDQVIDVTIAVDRANSDDAFNSVPDVPLRVTVLDNGAGLIVIESGGFSQVSEAGTQDTLTVMLNGEPTSNVVLTVTSLDVSEVTASPETLTFTPENWAQAQTVTLTGVDDDYDDGDQVIDVRLEVDPALSDEKYAAVQPQTVSVTTLDDDTAGLWLVPTPGPGGTTTVSEDGSLVDTLMVVLDARPHVDVVVSVTSGDLAEVTVSPTQLTFTTDNWSAPQPVTVTGVDDDVADGDQVTIVTATVIDAISDADFQGLSATAEVTTLDDEIAGFLFDDLGGITVSESGTTDVFEVVLTTQPVSAVVLRVTADDPSEVEVLTPTVTFLPSNWNNPQPVIVRGVEDDLVDGDQVTTVRVSVDDAQSDPAFHSVGDRTVSVTTLDNDAPGFQFSHTGGSTTVTEAGGTDSVTVVLTARPIANVVIAVTSSDVGEVTVTPTQLTFTTTNWNVAQTVSVSAVDDDIDDGDLVVQITAAVDPALSHVLWHGLPSQSLSVTTVDDDNAGITVTPTSGLVTTEAGGTAQFTVVLTSQPTANVTIALSSSDTNEGLVTPTSLTFTPTNWSAQQTATVTGVDDAVDDGDVAYTIMTAPATSSDTNYNNRNAADVSVTNVDNDETTLSINDVTVTEGNSGTVNAVFTVTRSIAGSQTVTVNYATGNGTAVAPADYAATSGQLTFNSGGALSQTVTVLVNGDVIDEPDETFTVGLSNPSNATISDNSGLGTILDDD